MAEIVEIGQSTTLGIFLVKIGDITPGSSSRILFSWADRDSDPDVVGLSSSLVNPESSTLISVLVSGGLSGTSVVCPISTDTKSSDTYPGSSANSSSAWQTGSAEDSGVWCSGDCSMIDGPGEFTPTGFRGLPSEICCLGTFENLSGPSAVRVGDRPLGRPTHCSLTPHH